MNMDKLRSWGDGTVVSNVKTRRWWQPRRYKAGMEPSASQ